MPETALIALRPVEADDLPLLLELYGSTRAAELALVPWDAAQRAAFVRLQFDAQTAFYQSEYPDAVHSMVLRNGEVVGRLYLHRRAQEVRILDLILLPHQHGEDSGELLLSQLKADAQSLKLPLNFHLEPFNTLRSLFEEAGFVQVTDNGTRALYEWRAH